MNEQDEFAIKFGDWLNLNCDTIGVDGKWKCYIDGYDDALITTKELLKIYKDEMDKEN